MVGHMPNLFFQCPINWLPKRSTYSNRTVKYSNNAVCSHVKLQQLTSLAIPLQPVIKSHCFHILQHSLLFVQSCMENFSTPHCSVNYQLSPTFHSNAISLRVIILQTSGFHQSIAHPFVTLETKFYVNDVITASVMCKKLAHVIYQLPATVIYYRPPIHFPISFISQCLNFVP